MFLPDDPQELVDASLACRACLSGAIDWSLDAEGYDASVLCTCRDCGDTRRVYLSGLQALRLALIH